MGDKSLIQNVYLFKGLNPEQLEAVGSIVAVESFIAGDDIFSQNDFASAMYIIKHGSVKIYQKTEDGDNIEVTNLGTGSHFGEMPFVDGEKRSASATAVERSEVLKVDYEKLRGILRRDANIAVHVYRELCLFLCGRLRITTNDLSYAREKNLRHF